MDRRKFIALAVAGAAGVGAIATTGGIPLPVSKSSSNKEDLKPNTHSANTSPYKEGVHYNVLNEPLNSPKNEIAEFMWLGCPHCYSLEPSLHQYITDKKEAVFVRHAPALSPNWKSDSLFFYALRKVTKDDQAIFAKAFKGIQDKTLTTASENSITDFAKENNINSFELASALKDTDIKNNTTEAIKFATQAGLRGVPALVIGGKYIPKLDAPGLKSYGDYFKIVEHVYQLSNK